MVTINIGTKTTKKRSTSKKPSALKTANDVTRLASNVLTVDKKARDAKAARAKDKEAKAAAAKAAQPKPAPQTGEQPQQPALKRICPNCGNIDVSGAVFCPACDAKME
ncbi:MAG: hypothetical protein FWG58_04415 [Methanomassiliicoccaceae archaeon]|nr:hypothetical protein [Methanomassiliicoccaceae archaeon]